MASSRTRARPADEAAKLRREALLREYGEAIGLFKALTDIRFRLVGLLPIAAVAAAMLRGDKWGVSGVALSVFGLWATIGLILYNVRNDELYDELVGRAAAIERELGLPDGGFANRMASGLSLQLFGATWKADHRAGISAVYRASIALWLFGVLAPAVGFLLDRHLGLLEPGERALPGAFIALAAAWWLTHVVGNLVQWQKTAQETHRRTCAERAVALALHDGFPAVLRPGKFLDTCAELGRPSLAEVEARAKFLRRLAPEQLSEYVHRGSAAAEAAHYVGLLTDCPPRWILDCHTDRLGLVAKEMTERGRRPFKAPRGAPAQRHAAFVPPATEARKTYSVAEDA